LLLTTYATLCKSNNFGQVATNLCCALSRTALSHITLSEILPGCNS